MATVDMRSDTLTMPSPEMREAMAAAALGDDVFGEDPSINRLQEVAAERLGKEAALFVSSGTMGNLIGILVSARSGEEIIADADSHTFLAEAGGAATLGGIQIMPVSTEAGVMAPDQVAEAIRTEDQHHPRTAAVTFEDTHNYHGGIAWPLAALRAAADEAHRNGLAVHLDGARLFNAAVATGTDPREIAACADTVTFCQAERHGVGAGGDLRGRRRATAALKIRAPSRWTRKPCSCAASLAARSASSGHTMPPCRLCVSSNVIAAVMGWCGSSRGRTASTTCSRRHDAGVGADGPDLHPAHRGRAGRLVVKNVGFGVRDQLLAPAGVDGDPEQVAHGAAGQKWPPPCPSARRRPPQPVGRRIVAENVVAERRGDHRLPHLGPGHRDGVRA